MIYEQEVYNKNSFVLYTSNKEFVEILSDEEAGKLFKSLFYYVAKGEELEFENKHTLMAFKIIKQQLDMNIEKYNKYVEKQRQNGLKGGAPKGNKNALKKQTKQPKTSQTSLYDNDNVYVNDNVNEYDYVYDNEDVVVINNKEINNKKNKKTTISTTEKNKNLNYASYGKYKNVFLNSDNLPNILEYFNSDSLLMNKYIDELSEDIKNNKYNDFDENKPDTHQELLITCYIKDKYNKKI